MRIEILVGSEEPKIHTISKPKTLLGSSESCDIIVSAVGVSRKHLMLLIEDNTYYVVDQGSTNGSFINEERLTPGKKIEFTSFFPVRLGADVLITFLSDEGSSRMMDKPGKTNPVVAPSKPLQTVGGGATTTHVLPLKAVKEATTQKLIKKRDEQQNKSKASKDSPKYMSPVIILIGLIMLGGAIYYKFYFEPAQIESDAVALPPPIKKAKVGEETGPSPVKAPPLPQVPQSELTSKDSFKTMANDMACVGEIEKYFCDLIPNMKDVPKQGVIQRGTMINVIRAGQNYIALANGMIPVTNPPADVATKEKEIFRVAAFLFLLDLPKTIDFTKLKDLKMTIGFMNSDFSNCDFALAILPENLQMLLGKMDKERIEIIRKDGVKAIEYAEKYYQIY